jgi:hypothetical protein
MLRNLTMDTGWIIYKKTKTHNMEEDVQRRKLEYFGHVIRMNQAGVEVKSFESKSEGRRKVRWSR